MKFKDLQNAVDVFNNAFIFKQELPTNYIYADIIEY